MRFGGPVHVESDDPEEVARAHRKLGYRAGICPQVDLKDSERIKEIQKTFAANDVVIAEVGAWCNMLAPDAEEREKNLDYVISRMQLAEAVGALCCVNIAGSFNPAWWDGPHPDNLSDKALEMTVENVRRILDMVQPKRSFFALEMMPWALPDGPDSCLELLRAVDRRQFAIHFDPVNIINSPSRYYNNSAVLRECFQKLGRWIVSCHAKDTLLHERLTVHLDEVRPGTGALDYDTYLRELDALPGEVPLLLEHLPSEEEYALARQFLFDKAKRLGISF